MRSANLWQSFGYAVRGLSYALRTQRNMRIHSAAGILVLGLGFFLSLAPLEWALLVVAITLVMAAELVNTAVEAAVDVSSPDFHPLASVAKDVAAGAVLLTAVAAVVIGALVLGPHVLAMVGR